MVGPIGGLHRSVILPPANHLPVLTMVKSRYVELQPHQPAAWRCRAACSGRRAASGPAPRPRFAGPAHNSGHVWHGWARGVRAQRASSRWSSMRSSPAQPTALLMQGTPNLFQCIMRRSAVQNAAQQVAACTACAARTAHRGICEVALPARDGQLAGQVSHGGVGDAQVALAVLKVNGVDLQGLGQHERSLMAITCGRKSSVQE